MTRILCLSSNRRVGRLHLPTNPRGQKSLPTLLLLEVPEAELHLVRDMLPKLMCGVAELDVPLLVELGEGKNWDEAH